MRVKSKKRGRSTKHGRRKQTPSVRAKISSLRRAWGVLDPCARGDRLHELIRLGCSRRGLAQDIDVSPTNIRFHLDLADLSPIQKQAVREGASAKVAFAAVHQQREIEVRNERVRQEQATSAISDRLAEDIASFCVKDHPWGPKADEQVIVVTEGHIEQLFGELKGAIEMRLQGYVPRPNPAPQNVNFNAVCLEMRPDQKDYDFWLVWLVEWLAPAILRFAPEALIRDAALKKAPSLLAEKLRKKFPMKLRPQTKYFRAVR